MSEAYRSVPLMQNRLYPSFQLHAFMGNKSTKPEDGLRLAALVTVGWLVQRLGDCAPENLTQMPKPAAYLETTNDLFCSFHFSQGFVVDIVFIPDKSWTLQITEPDLGSDPGNPNQQRPAIASRTIQSNIAYHITPQGLECGFKTIISDSEQTTEPAEVYRYSIIRQLLDLPAFGLRQVTPLTYDPLTITSKDGLKDLYALWQNPDGHLPFVIFTQKGATVQQPIAPLVPLPFAPTTTPDLKRLSPAIPTNVLPPTTESKSPYDVMKFAKSGFGLCRTYVLSESMINSFNQRFSVHLTAGDVLFLSPKTLGGDSLQYPYKAGKHRQEETYQQLYNLSHIYPREKEISFGNIVFLSAARSELLQSVQAIRQSVATAPKELEQALAMAEIKWQSQLEQKDQHIQQLERKLTKSLDAQTQLQQESERVQQKNQHEVDQLQILLGKEKDITTYLRRKCTQPTDHTKLPDWVKTHFNGRLFLHEKAVNLLLDKRVMQGTNLGLLCDALDFLATDYWVQRYERISEADMKSRCTAKYGRPFEIKPTGTTTVEFSPSEYKIKYFIGKQGKPVESPLDTHLIVGTDPQHLLRIYFLHDDAKKIIVIGSLPKHLTTVKFK